MIDLLFLGTGTSQGVPIIGCTCEVCKSKNPKDKRLRSSVLFKIENKNILVDCGPDFRQQMLRENIDNIDAILITHEHKDHIAGLDDVRPINFLQKKDMPIYAEGRVLQAIKNEFHYAFSENAYPGIPKFELHEINSAPFEINSIPIIPVRAYHNKLPVLGFRIGNIAYITDTNHIDEEECKKLKDLDILVINALRKEQHISHFNLEQAIAFSEKVKPKQTYFTHISHQLGLHTLENANLPKSMNLAFDRLLISAT